MTAQAVVDYYVEHLGGAWQHKREDILFTAPLFPGEESQQRGRIPTVRLTQEDATVFVEGEGDETLEMDREHGAEAVPYEFSVTINSRGAVRKPFCD
jgi:hypothetical protein